MQEFYAKRKKNYFTDKKRDPYPPPPNPDIQEKK